jgi:hypothetical protein
MCGRNYNLHNVAAGGWGDSGRLVGKQEVIQKRSSRKLAGLVPGSVQLAFARQDANERGERDDAGRRSEYSYSPRRH